MSLDFSLKSPPCPHCGRYDESLDFNITHNLNKMAAEAGIYKALWRPDEQGWTKVSDIIGILKEGLQLLRSDLKRFKQFNADNGWGVYEDFLGFVSDVVSACEEHPDYLIEVSR